MIVRRLWAANELRNFQYLIGCPETGEALALDPFDGASVLAAARELGWTITQVLNTHEHRDHTAGNAAVVAATGAKVLTHERAAACIGGVDIGLAEGSVVRVGKSVELECIDTPGHTMTHVCLFAHAAQDSLFSGDTLFSAGVGNCFRGGDPSVLFDTCRMLLRRLPPDTHLYPGHDYLINNLAFTLSVEPGNPEVLALQREYGELRPEEMPILTLRDELGVNSFFRLQEPALRAGLAARAPQLSSDASDREVFLALRELRNHW